MNSKKVVIFVVSVFVLLCSEALSKDTPLQSLLPKKPPEGWKQIGSPQAFDSKNLFNRINGQAELFFKYGFQKSVFAHYQNKSNSKDQIELDLYDMGNVLQAFGVFSRFRSEDRSAGVGLESHLEDVSLLFYQGRYFVMLYATEPNPALLKKMGTAVSSNITDPSPAPREIGYFPREGLRPGSIEYYPEGLLGYRFLQRGFQGVYLEKAEQRDQLKTEHREIHLFLAIFKNPRDAGDALKAYRERLSKKGKIDSGMPASSGPDALRGEDPDRGKVMVLMKGSFLPGIAGFDSVAYAERLLEEFVRNIP